MQSAEELLAVSRVVLHAVNVPLRFMTYVVVQAHHDESEDELVHDARPQEVEVHDVPSHAILRTCTVSSSWCTLVAQERRG
jgi:hypothetical protein